MAKKNNNSQEFIYEVIKLYYDRFNFYKDRADDELFSVVLVQTYPIILWGLLKLYRLGFESEYTKEFALLLEKYHVNFIKNKTIFYKLIIKLVYEVYFLSELNKFNRHLKKILINILYFLNKTRLTLTDII